MSMTVSRVNGALGANVTGVDLSAPLSEKEVADLRAALLEHLVLFFRGQKTIEPGAQLALGERFGKLHMHPTIPHMPGFPGVMVIKTDENSKGHFGPMWHSDVSCDPEPPMGTILQIHTPPPYGGETMFANMYAAYEDLSAPMKHFLCGLTAMHESSHLYGGDPKVNDPRFPKSEHPLVRTHPETGRQALFVSRLFTTRIVGLSPMESTTLLEMLWRHIENPYFHVRLHWGVNDVAFWDNRCTQHMAIWDYKPHRRSGHRVTVCGDRPFYRA